ncbi:MAG: endo-alpha-N-acetylgalactosaminidase family protein [Planctomycetota bacterium]|nr:endo-alpha-N-acetylgalactosaminidase family protein [Planctomycetota bacterium]MDA1138046.1 endo-alpha-N-acetylgalactosaminidase family protein [Planctomycetota bacterium]
MNHEPSGEYYDYTKTMKPERPWLVQWDQSLVYRIMHALRGRDGKIDELFVAFEQALEVIKRVYHLTCGVQQIVFLTGWQFEGHDSKYPSWAEVNRHLKRACDETALDSLRWLIREARQYNCIATLHINMFDAYADSPLFQEYLEKDIIAKDKDGQPIIGNEWWGMDCYHVSYTQEWKHGLAQKRIDDQQMVDGSDLCIPACWCEDKALIAYSKDGCDSKTWELSPDWKAFEQVKLSRITLHGHEAIGEAKVVDVKITLSLGKGEALKISA